MSRPRISFRPSPLRTGLGMAVALTVFAGWAVAATVPVAARRPVPPRRPAAAAPTAAPAVSAAELQAFARLSHRPQPTGPLAALPPVVLRDVHVGAIPRVALAAYLSAARALAAAQPSCGLRWWLVAGIGFVESDHAASGGSGRPGWDGIARPPIFGPLLDGTGGFPAMPDTDRGALDGNARWDRAVGPTQFLPSTWRTWGADGNRDGRADPQDISDAALATGRYLCAAGEHLGNPANMAVAVFAYNHSFDYVRLVLSVAARYAGLDPAALGVDGLPHDAPGMWRHATRTRRAGPRRTARPATTAARSRPPTTTGVAPRTSSTAPATTSAPGPVLTSPPAPAPVLPAPSPTVSPPPLLLPSPSPTLGL